MAHGNGLAEIASAEALRAGLDVVERAQQAAHVQERQQGEQQQRAQGVAQQARAALEGRVVEAELDGMAVGRGAREQALPVFLATPALAAPVARAGVALAAQVVTQPFGLALIGVRAPGDTRAGDVDGERQAPGDGLRALDVRCAACGGFGGEAVHVVHEQRARGLAPAERKRLLRTADEGEGHGQREQHEHQHQPQLDGMAQALARAAVPGLARVGGGRGAGVGRGPVVHGARRRSASE
ncbi:hypothetical protein D9M68_771680 [compost metagenome]